MRIPSSLSTFALADASDQPLARLADNALLSTPAWRAKMLAWYQDFAAVKAGKVALYFDDAVEFSAALFGAWHAQKTVFLAGDNQAATHAKLQALGCVFVERATGEVETTVRPEFAPLHLETPRLVLFTSGSSGEPSLVSKNIRQLDAEIAALEAQFGAQLSECEIAASVSPQHIYGLLFCVLWPLCCKRVFDARRLAYSEQIPRRASTGKVALVSSPALLTRLNLPNAVTEPNDLVAVFSSGGKLEQAQAQGASAALGAPVLEILGSTETGGIAWRAHNATQAAQTWQVFLPVHWRELDSRLQLRSPYLPDPDFWFVCNDLVQVVSERSFIHLGRADRIVKVEEKRLSLDAMEKHLAQFDGVIAAKAHMAADSRHDFGMVCALQPELLARLSAGQKRAMVSALKAHLLEAFEPVVLPRRWRFVPQLPINAQGKTTHAGLQALFERRAIPIIFTQHLARVCEILLCPQAEQLYFDGHFPRIAVLPGAAMLDWAIHLAASHFALAKTPSRIDALKFQKVVFPYHAILLRLIYDQGKNSVNFTYESTVGAHASGRLIYTAEQSA